MDKKLYRGSITKKLIPFSLFVLIFAFVLYFVLTGLNEAYTASDAEGLRIAEESIRRAVINCYASEGMYPQTYEYLKEHYGIAVDESKYVVHYQIFASNIMPDIAVFRI